MGQTKRILINGKTRLLVPYDAATRVTQLEMV